MRRLFANSPAKLTFCCGVSATTTTTTTTTTSLRHYKSQHASSTPTNTAAAPSSSSPFSQTMRSSSCMQESPAPQRPLTALQKRQMQMKDKKIFSLTATAVYRIKTLLDAATTKAQQHQGQRNTNDDDDETPIGIRIGVKKRGCSGYSYTVNYEYASSKKKPNDMCVEQNGVSVFVDGDALFYVIGTQMDFFTSNVEEKFTFKNPNEKEACGCGESFMPFDV